MSYILILNLVGHAVLSGHRRVVFTSIQPYSKSVYSRSTMGALPNVLRLHVRTPIPYSIPCSGTVVQWFSAAFKTRLWQGTKEVEMPMAHEWFGGIDQKCGILGVEVRQL